MSTDFQPPHQVFECQCRIQFTALCIVQRSITIAIQQIAEAFLSCF
ncbi:MAG: hypothetical protein SF029_05390 [bacterium]|nr:hypothetical protein [bacterium]